MMLSRLFKAPGVAASKFRRRNQSRSRNSVRLADVLEQLEQRRLLTVSYSGVAWSDTSSSEERFWYQVDVQKSGDAGELWMRYNAQYNRLDFDTNSGFTNITTGVPIEPPSIVGSPRSAPFSVPGIVTEWPKVLPC